MNDFNIKFTSIASGSGGNCYLLEGKEEKILLEAGIPVARINQGLDHKLSEISACFVSHSHKDHSKAIFDVAARGVDIHALTETLKGFPKHHRYNSLKFRNVEAGRAYAPIRVGDEFTVFPIPVVHDVENVGFLIHSNFSGEKLLFIIDTFYSKFTFTGITHYCMECNYSAAILKENVERDGLNKKYVDRIYQSHFSLENLCDFFDANDLSECKEIHLMHMSSTNGDAKLFENVIKTKTGINNVNVCGV